MRLLEFAMAGNLNGKFFMEIKKDKRGWLYNGNIFTTEEDAHRAKKADEDPEAEAFWSKLDYKVPENAQPELAYDGIRSATSFGTFVTKFVSENSMSIVRLAKEIGVSKQSVFDWMNGKSIPSTNHALKLIQVTGCSTDMLMQALSDNFQKQKEQYLQRLKVQP